MHGPTAIASRRDVGDHRHVGSVTKMDGLDAGCVPQGQDPPASSGMWQKRCQSLRHHHGTRGGSYDAGSPVLREGWGRGLPPGCCGRQEGGEAQGNNAWLSSQHEGPQPGSVLPGDSRKQMSSSSPPWPARSISAVTWADGGRFWCFQRCRRQDLPPGTQASTPGTASHLPSPWGSPDGLNVTQTARAVTL